MPVAVDIGSLIERNHHKGGRPCIAGTGVTVRCIAVWSNHTRLPLAQVDAALAYYHTNRQEVDQDLAARKPLKGISCGSSGRER